MLSNWLGAFVDIIKYDFHEALLAVGETPHLFETFLNFFWRLSFETLG